MLLSVVPAIFALGLMAQEAPPPPPAPLTEPAPAAGPEAEKAAAEAGPVEEADPVEPAPVPPPPPPEATPAPPAATPKPDAKPAESTGIDTPAMAALQVAIGTGACCVGCCIAVPFTVPLSIGLAIVPVANTLVPGLVSDVVIGTTVGAAEGIAGDALGKNRGALIVPVASSVGMLALGTVASTVLGFFSPPVVVDPNNPQAVLSSQVAGAAGLARAGIGCGTLVGAIVLPAILYSVMSTPKKPGDTGQGFPGIMSPADPTPAAPPPPSTSPGTVAMRF